MKKNEKNHIYRSKSESVLHQESAQRNVRRDFNFDLTVRKDADTYGKMMVFSRL